MITYPFDADIPEDRSSAANAAIDIADQMTVQAIDAAQHTCISDEALVIQLAAANIQAAAIVYATHAITTAMRELTPEIAGAISEHGTDTGAGIALAVQQVLNALAHNKTPKANDGNSNND
jgi:hypothetical protein